MIFKKKYKRFEARRCGTQTFMGMQLFGVWDNKTDFWARQDEINTVTTKSGAKARARWANKEYA